MEGPRAERGPFGLPRLDPESRRKALAEPGASWKEWFFSSFAKVYLGLALFIGDAIVVASWLEFGSLAGALGSLPPLAYLEYLLYEYLWFEPGSSQSVRRAGFRGATRPSGGPGGGSGGPEEEEGWRRWVHPFAFGRWSESAKRVRRGQRPLGPGPSGPDPSEFA